MTDANAPSGTPMSPQAVLGEIDRIVLTRQRDFFRKEHTKDEAIALLLGEVDRLTADLKAAYRRVAAFEANGQQGGDDVS